MICLLCPQKRPKILSPNDEVVNSSKKPSPFKTRLHKPYPISDKNGRIDTLFQKKAAQKKHTLWHGTYLYSLYKGPGAKNALQIMSLAAYASETNDVLIISIILAKRDLHNDVS